MFRNTFLTWLLFLVASCCTTTLQAQDSQQFETKFWQFLMGNNYKQWSPGPGQDGDFFSGQVPHGALLKLYINRSAASNVDGLQVGSVVVLENYRSDKSLKSVSVMYRTEGFNPSANDWYWIEYNPDGSTVKDTSSKSAAVTSMLEAADDEESVAVAAASSGRNESCIACHGQAGGSDFAFFNDRAKSNLAGGNKSETLSLR